MIRRVTGVHSRLLIRRAIQWLQARGWSAGEATLNVSDRVPRWKVDATHTNSGETLSVSATTPSGAWEIACRKVGRLSTDLGATHR